MTLATRYLAECSGSRATVNLVWARRMPNWATSLGALPELAAAMTKAKEAGVA